MLVGPGDVAAAVKQYGFLPTPVNPDTGEAYVYCLVLPNGEDYLFADSITELMDGIIPGYDTMEPVDAAEARILAAGHAAAWLQAAAISTLTADEFDALDEADILTLLAPRLGPDAAQADWWRPNIPLYVVDTSYDPYTQLLRPASPTDGTLEGSTIRWIRPGEEEDFIMSLHEAGFVRLMENFARE